MAASNDQDCLLAIQNHLNRWLTELFLRKLPDWQHEDEYRWIFFDDNPEPLYIAFEDALKAIIVGNGVPKNMTNEILRYCVCYNAAIAEMNWSNGFPKVEHAGQPYLTHRHLLDEK